MKCKIYIYITCFFINLYIFSLYIVYVYFCSVKNSKLKDRQQFQALFDPLDAVSEPGGWVLLKPAVTKPLEVEIEGTVAEQRAPGKRIKMMTRIPDENGSSFQMVAPSVSTKFKSDNESDMFPQIGISHNCEYQIVAGSTVTVGTSVQESILPLLRKIIVDNDENTIFSAYAEGITVNNTLQTEMYTSIDVGMIDNGVLPIYETLKIPQLLSVQFTKNISKMYLDDEKLGVSFACMDYDKVLELIRRECESKKKSYIEKVEQAIQFAENEKTRINAPNGQIDRGYLYELDYVINFLKWCLKSPGNYVVCGYQRDFPFYYQEVATRTVQNNSQQLPPVQSNNTDELLPGDFKSHDIGKTTPMVNVMREIARSRGRIVGANPGEDVWGNFQAMLNSRTSIEANPPSERFIFVNDLMVCTVGKTFVNERPKMARGEDAIRAPTVVTPAYRPLVLHSENELRFKLSLIPNVGVNPMFWNDQKDPASEFAVSTGDQRIEFDADMKAFEFNLQLRDLKG